MTRFESDASLKTQRVAFAACGTEEGLLKVTVTLPGGDLTIDWRERDDHVLMTGPVEYEFEGRFDAGLFAALQPEGVR